MMATLFRTLWGWGVLVWLNWVWRGGQVFGIKELSWPSAWSSPIVRIGARTEGSTFRDSDLQGQCRVRKRPLRRAQWSD